jgi:predicted esterase
MVVVCTTVGLAAMAVAPVARSQTPVGSPVAVAAPASAPGAAASSTGEQATLRAAAPPEIPAWIEAENATGKAFVYPPHPSQPGAEAARPVTVLLHGMCGHPQSACGPFVDVSTSRGWLVCPRGEDVCGGGTRWRLRGPDDAKLVDASVNAVAGEHAGEVDLTAPRVLVGFSLGGIAAVQIAQASSGKYAGLVVIASQVHPDAAMLKKAGVKRVVLAAGDMDMTSAPLQQDARALAAQGMPTRFVSLGNFGHGYPADMQERMREPMTWVAGGG